MKNKSDIRILAIETSCDETAAAVICGTNNTNRKSQITNHKQIQISNIQVPNVLSNIVASQVDLHAKTGGVVPEVASRAHMEAMIPVINEALDSADCKLSDITYIAVTAGPGLIGSLLVGFNTAKALAYSLDLPIIPVNHIEGHIYSALSGENPKSETLIRQLADKQIRNSKSQKSNLTIKQFNNEPEFPILALTVSGGHSSLTLVKDHGVYENLGSTLDDAAGEAFDKVAKLLDLGYPGGPAVSRHAAAWREKNSKPETLNSKQIINPKLEIRNNRAMKQSSNEIVFPRPILNDGTYNFSFSGLKTAVLTEVKKLTANNLQLTVSQKEEICAAFEDATVDVLTTKTMRAVSRFKPRGVILAGGVAANKRLKEELNRKVDEYNEKLNKKDKIDLYLPPHDMTGDNAAMIGIAAFYHILKGDVKRWDEIKIDSNLKL